MNVLKELCNSQDVLNSNLPVVEQDEEATTFDEEDDGAEDLEDDLEDDRPSRQRTKHQSQAALPGDQRTTHQQNTVETNSGLEERFPDETCINCEAGHSSRLLFCVEYNKLTIFMDDWKTI